MAKFTYVSLENLQLYDSLSKQYFDGKISEESAKALKTVAIEGNKLKFYTVSAPVGSTSPAFEISLPETDLTDVQRLIKNATAGDVVTVNANGSVADGGVKLTDLAKKADVTSEIGDAKTELEGKIKTNTDAIGVLNGEGEGSVKKAVKDAQTTLQAQITANKDVLDKLDGADTVDGSVKKQVKDAKEAVESKIGSLDSLETTAKADVVSAVNEVKAAIDSVKTAGEVTVDTETTTEGMAKSYTLKQNGKTVATIDIPKDMVVSSGAVETNPKGQPEGTYLVLTLANATNDKVYINVGTLVDIYKPKAEATQVQIAIDASTREISATIVAGSITATELASNAVTTVKIADGNVTKAKLATDVQASLGKADSALQESDVSALRTDVANVKASLAEGGATAKAIAEAKSAASTAQAGVDGLTTRVKALEDVSYVAATEDEIRAMFTKTK